MSGVKEIQCSFCGKKDDEVQNIVASPNGDFICGECISKCVEFLTEEGARFEISSNKSS